MFCRPIPNRVVALWNPLPSSVTENARLAVLATQSDRDVRRVRVLRHVLHRLEHREVDGRLDLPRVPADAVAVDGHGERRLASLRLERLGQTPVGEERRVDPAGEVAEVLQRVLRVVEDAVERLALLLLVLTDHPFGHPNLHRQRDELLLRPVVDVAFQPPALFVLCCDQPLTRRAEVLDQPEVLQDQPGLRGQVREQLVLLGHDRIVRRLRDGERAEQLAPVADRDGCVRVGERGERRALRNDRRMRLRRLRPRRGRTHLGADAQPDGGVGRAGPLRQQPRHARKEMLARERLADVRGEPREDLIGCGALAVDHPVRGALRPLASGLERDRDERGGDERQELRRARRTHRPRRRTRRTRS